MIHHVSIPARDPQHVAEVLAELMGGKSYPFVPLPGAFFDELIRVLAPCLGQL